jgi:KaiC/GvpD/RAD55 family RecA-like ATPase
MSVCKHTPLAERVLKLGTQGQPISTGLPSLDDACRGGFRPVDVVAIGAPTEQGKTTFMVQLALRWALAGCRVVIVAFDEDADGLTMRVAQGLGLVKGNAPASLTDEIRADLAERLRALQNLVIVDSFEDDPSIEEAAELLFSLPGDGQTVLCVDSIQEARCKWSNDVDGAKAKVDAICRSLKRVARRGAIVLATSELSRAAGEKDPRKRPPDINAYKESGAIEHAIKKGLILREIEPGRTLVTVVKNRGFPKAAFELRLDFETATYSEVVTASESSVPKRDAREVLLETVRANPGINGKEALLRKAGLGNTERCEIDALLSSGEVLNRGSDKRPKFHVNEPAPVAPIRLEPAGRLSPNPPNPPSPLLGAGGEASKGLVA